MILYLTFCTEIPCLSIVSLEAFTGDDACEDTAEDGLGHSESKNIIVDFRKFIKSNKNGK